MNSWMKEKSPFCCRRFVTSFSKFILCHSVTAGAWNPSEVKTTSVELIQQYRTLPSNAISHYVVAAFTEVRCGARCAARRRLRQCVWRYTACVFDVLEPRIINELYASSSSVESRLLPVQHSTPSAWRAHTHRTPYAPALWRRADRSSSIKS